MRPSKSNVVLNNVAIVLLLLFFCYRFSVIVLLLLFCCYCFAVIINAAIV